MPERPWTWVEVDVLSRRYPIGGARVVAPALGRTPDGVTSMARRLGVPSPRRLRNLGESRSPPPPDLLHQESEEGVQLEECVPVPLGQHDLHHPAGLISQHRERVGLFRDEQVCG